MNSKVGKLNIGRKTSPDYNVRFNQDVNECFDQILHRKENTACTGFSLDFHDYENALVKYILEK